MLKIRTSGRSALGLQLRSSGGTHCLKPLLLYIPVLHLRVQDHVDQECLHHHLPTPKKRPRNRTVVAALETYVAHYPRYLDVTLRGQRMLTTATRKCQRTSHYSSWCGPNLRDPSHWNPCALAASRRLISSGSGSIGVSKQWLKPRSDSTRPNCVRRTGTYDCANSPKSFTKITTCTLRWRERSQQHHHKPAPVGERTYKVIKTDDATIFM